MDGKSDKKAGSSEDNESFYSCCRRYGRLYGRFVDFFLFNVILIVVVIVSGCGAAADSRVSDSPAFIDIQTPSGTQSGYILINYTITDVDSNPSAINVQYSLDCENWFPATEGPGSDGLTGLSATPAGASHVFVWDSVSDFVGVSEEESGVRIKIVPFSITMGNEAVTGAFSVSNMNNTAPAVDVQTPYGEQSQSIQIDYTLYDVESDVCIVQVEYSIGRGPWTNATVTPTTGLVSSPSGTAQSLEWDSYTDGVATSGVEDEVRIRIRPGDGNGYGDYGYTDFIKVNNFEPNQKPTVSIIGGPTGNTVDTKPLFSFSGSDSDGFIAGYRVSIDEPIPSDFVNSTSWQPGSPLSLGEHTFYVKAEDDDGGFSSVDSRTFTVVSPTGPPALLAITCYEFPSGSFESELDNGSWTAAPTVCFTWSGNNDTSCFYAYFGQDAPSANGSDYSLVEAECSSRTLARGVNYFYLIAANDLENAAAVIYAVNLDETEPAYPGPCWCNGRIEPTDVYTDAVFTAVYADSAGDVADRAHVEVGTDQYWDAAETWNSGWISIDDTPEGGNCPGITCSSTYLELYNTYYWRIRFSDKAGNEGPWSDTQWFVTGNLSSIPTIVTVGPGGSYDYLNINDACAGIAAGDFASEGLDNCDLAANERSLLLALNGTWEECALIEGWNTNPIYNITLRSDSAAAVIYTTESNPVLTVRSEYVSIENVVLSQNGTGSYALLIDNAGRVTVQNSTLISDPTGYCTNLSGEDLLFDNCIFTGGYGIFDNSSGVNGPEIRNSYFYEFQYPAVYLGLSKGVKLHHNRFTTSGYPEGAVYMADYSDLLVYNNIIDAEHCSFYAMKLTGAGSSNNASRIVNNTIVSPGSPSQTGVRIADPDYGTTHFVNNIVTITYNSVAIDLVNASAVNVECDYNCVAGAGTDGYFGQYNGTPCYTHAQWQSTSTFGSNSITDDPGFLSTDPASDDWLRISGSSPCAGYGTNLSAVFTDDVDGEARPASSAWCIGADEAP